MTRQVAEYIVSVPGPLSLEEIVEAVRLMPREQMRERSEHIIVPKIASPRARKEMLEVWRQMRDILQEWCSQRVVEFADELASRVTKDEGQEQIVQVFKGIPPETSSCVVVGEDRWLFTSAECAARR